MGGQSTTEQKQTQNSTTNPWEQAVPQLQGLLGQVSQGLGNTDLTAKESGALNRLEGGTNPFTAQIGSYARNLLNGGAATKQAGNVNANYQRYVGQTNPLASNMNYNPYDTPGFKDALNTTIDDITSQTNGQFAAAGRDFSGMNSQTLGRGIMQGVAPTIAAQFNTNREAQQGAAGNLYNAGNTNAGILAGMQQQKLANQGVGVGASQAAVEAKNYQPNSIMAAEAARRGIPVQALGLLAQIGIPIAGLGGQSTGTSNTQGTQQMSGVDQFAKIAGSLGSLFGGKK